MNQFGTGDIVFVLNYEYKNGSSGNNHSFVIIDDGQAVPIDYFGFLISSKTKKDGYDYNERLYKDNVNCLREDSIVKCDDLIRISESEIQFKIGRVDEDDLKRFIDTYEKYLESNITQNDNED